MRDLWGRGLKFSKVTMEQLGRRVAEWRPSLLAKGLKVNTGKSDVIVGSSGNGWMEFREFLPLLTSRAPPLEMKGRVYASCVRSSMTYGSETRPLLADFGLKFERAEMQMIRWMCAASLKDRRMSEELRKMVGLSLSQLSLEVVG